jgi:hypothetical protein
LGGTRELGSDLSDSLSDGLHSYISLYMALRGYIIFCMSALLHTICCIKMEVIQMLVSADLIRAAALQVRLGKLLQFLHLLQN